jgi:nucleotide-binding universal stress UspA family protein
MSQTYEGIKSFTTHRVCEAGDPACVIADEAQAWRPDLVMMPPRGLGFFRRNLLGSATSKVLHDLDRPVWTSVHANAAPALEKIHCRRILCALDGGDRNGEIVAWAARLACEFQAQLGLVHAIPPLDAAEGGWYLGEDFARTASENAISRIEKLKSESGTEAANTFVKRGKVQTVITETAAEFHPDLLVIARYSDDRSFGGIFPLACSILSQSPCRVVSV